MNATHTAVLVLAALVVVAPMATAVPSSGAATMFDQETDTPTATPAGDSPVAPGEKLSGVVGVGAAELEGEVAERTFGVKVARADSPGAKAAVVAAQVDDLQARIDGLEQRKQTLKEARKNGSIDRGEYRAKMATVAAELSTARRLANVTERTAEGLPADVLAANGVDVEAIETLQDRARNLTGPEVAEIARSIAGESAGRSMAGTQRPDDVAKGLPGGPPNGTDGGPGGPPNGTDGKPGSDDRNGQGEAPGTDGEGTAS